MHMKETTCEVENSCLRKPSIQYVRQVKLPLVAGLPKKPCKSKCLQGEMSNNNLLACNANKTRK